MNIQPAPLPGLRLIQPHVFEDPRGYFFESFRDDKFQLAGIHDRFVQENQSRSVRNVLRGLHYQFPNPQAKLCRVVHGEVFDVAVDIRRGSPTFGRWYGVVLSAENRLQLYIPKGFAHGFVVRSESAEFLYKCSDYYDASSDRGLLWNDPKIGIDWQTAQPVLSGKDAGHPSLSDIPADLLPEYTP